MNHCKKLKLICINATAMNNVDHGLAKEKRNVVKNDQYHESDIFKHYGLPTTELNINNQGEGAWIDVFEKELIHKDNLPLYVNPKKNRTNPHSV